MFLQIFQEFLIPSVFLWIFFVVGIVLYFVLKNKKNIGIYFVIAGAALYYIFSVTPISDLILSPLESSYSKLDIEQEMSNPGAIVLLTGSREANTLRSAEVLRIYMSLKENKDKAPYIIVSGSNQALSPLKDEANIAKEILLESGIPGEDIVLEKHSYNTFSSAEEIKKILGKEKFYLVTSAYHMPRAMEVFQRLGADPIPAPANFKIIRDYNVFNIFPNSANLKKCDLAFREYFGLVYYKLKLKFQYGKSTN